jgi:hypothetical protein
MREFFLFNAVYFGTALLMLSIAAGKSDRYLFPVYACSINLSVMLFSELRNTVFERRLLQLGKWLSLLVVSALPFLALFSTVPGVSRSTLIIAAALSALPLVFLAGSCIRKRIRHCVIAILLTVLAARIDMLLVFAPFRNVTRSVKPIAAEIDRLLPPGAVLYNVELFERWITYYLKHLGRETRRLTPEAALAPAAVNGRAYLLLNEGEESWRLDQLREVDPKLRILRRFGDAHDSFLLVDAAADSLRVTEPHSYFPTVPSPPWYNDPRRAKGD